MLVYINETRTSCDDDPVVCCLRHANKPVFPQCCCPRTEMFASLFSKKRGRDAIKEDESRDIRERDVRKWQAEMVDVVFKKQCLRNVPFNVKSDYVVMGFYVPPPDRIDAPLMQRLVTFLDQVGHAYEVSIKWCSKTQNMLVYCLIGEFIGGENKNKNKNKNNRGGSSKRIRTGRGIGVGVGNPPPDGRVDMVRLTPEVPLEYEPTELARSEHLSEAARGLVSKIEELMLRTMWVHGTLNVEDLPKGEAADVLRHTMASPFVLTVLCCRRKIPLSAFMQIFRAVGVENAWIAWDTDLECLVTCAQSRY